MALVPVNYDPFAKDAGANRAPVLTEVDYDPFTPAPAKAPERGSAAETAKASSGRAAAEIAALAAALPNLGSREKAPARGIMPTFSESVGRGVDQLQGMLGGAVEVAGEATGIEALTTYGRGVRERNEVESASGPEPLRALDVRTLGDVGQFVKQTVGNQLPMMGPGLAGSVAGAAVAPAVGATATVGAAIGAFVPSFALGVGETQGAIKGKDKNAVAPGYAIVGGTLIGALDTVLPGKVGGKLVALLGREGAEAVADRVLKSTVLAGVKEGGKGALTEAVTEGFQEVIGEVTAAKATNQNVDWPGLAESVFEAALAGGIMGGGISGATGAAQQVKANRATVPTGIAPQVAPAVAAVPRVEITAADSASPIPNDLIAEGKAIIEGAKAVTTPNGLDPLFDENDQQIGWIDPTNGAMTPLGATPAAPAAPQAPTGLVAPTGPLANALGQTPAATLPAEPPVFDIEAAKAQAASQPSPVADTAGTSAPDAVMAAPTSNTGRVATKPASGKFDIDEGKVVTERRREVQTRLEAVDMADLIPSDDPRYDGALQPRDRAGRAQSAVQVQEIAAKLDPARLGANRLASQGAPIIGADNMVESGNGRTMAIREAYSSQPERAAAYRAMIEAEGIDTTGMAMPVLVRRRLTELSPEDRLAFVREANEDATSRMSAPEQAKVDAGRIDDALSLYRGGELTAATNRAFIRAFVESAVSPAERGQFIDANGNPSADGVIRVRRAMMAKAYGDSPVIAGLAESLDVNIKAIASALAEIAPRLALLKAELDAAGLAGDYDIGPNLADMAALISRARDEGVNVSVLLAQNDAFTGGVDPVTEDLVRLAFKDGDTRKPVGAAKLIEKLSAYADGVDAELERLQQGDGLFGATVPATNREIINAAAKRTDGPAAEQGSIFDAPESSVVAEDARPVEQGNGGTGQAAEVAPTPAPAQKAALKVGDLVRFAKNVDYLKAGVEYTVVTADKKGAVFRGDDGGQSRVSQILLNSTDYTAVPKAKEAPAAATEPAAAPKSAGRAKLVTDERAAELRKRMKAKLSGSQLNSGIDPEILAIGVELTVNYIENGVLRAVDVARAIAADLDVKMAQIRPYVRSWYNGARDMLEDSGASVDGMDTPEQVKAAMVELLAPATKPIETSAPVAAEPQPRAETAPAPTTAGYTIADTASGKGFTVSGATSTQLDAIRAALPNISVVPNKKTGDLLISKKHEAKVRAALDGMADPAPTPVTVEPVTEADELPAPVDMPAPETAPIITAERDFGTRENPNVPMLASDVADHFAAGNGFKTIVEARKFVADRIGGGRIEPGTTLAKQTEEAMELGVAIRAREIVAAPGTESAKYDALVKLYEAQPILGTRTSTSIEEQAYSTPAPLAYLASRRAGIIRGTSKVFEPTAGNGMLLMEAFPADITANELNADRLRNLKALLPGATITQGDAMTRPPLDDQVDVVITNPPFGKVAGDNGYKRWELPGSTRLTQEIDRAIAMRALEAMKDDGSAVLILGSVKAFGSQTRLQGYRGGDIMAFMTKLYQGYNVIDHFTVDGALYGRQGAGWPVDVIVIKGRGRSPLVLPSAIPPAVLTSWDDIKERLDDRVDTARERAGTGDDPVEAAAGDLFDAPSVSPGTGIAARPADNGGRGTGAGTAASGGGERAGSVGGRQPGTDSGTAGGKQQLAAGASSDAVGASESAVEGRPASAGDAAGAGGNAGGVSGGAVSGRVARENTEVETDYQVQYSPTSSATFAVGTLVPKNMQTAATKALDSIAARVGSIDAYVADKLGYTVAQSSGDVATGSSGYFSAEQVDAIALAIDNIERGGGFIIGDQTGVGKGRFVAAMLRYGQRNGMVPVFVTKDPGLYADMIRDMRDIGMPDIDKRVFVSNIDLRGEKAIPLSEKDGDTIQALPTAKHKAATIKMAENGVLPDGYDMLFTTYSQMQYGPGGAVYDRQRALLALGPNAMVVLDESHEAGGAGPDARKVTKEGEVIPTRADFVRELLGLSRGAIYSSATYAKNPNVMSLYFKTDLGNAVEKIEELGGLIESGGVPLQQVVANMLVESGQYLRRERSFDGVGMSLDTMDTNEEMARAAADALRQVFRLDVDFMETAREEFGDKLAAELGDNMTADGAVSEASASSTGFASVMHNVVSQMLLALKAPAVVDRAIALHKAGEKPIIALSNTNESILRDYIDDAGLSPGDDADLTFNAILLRYLQRLRRITVKDADGEKRHVVMTNADIAEHGGPDALAGFLAVEKLLTDIDLSDLPASPVDYIIDRLNAAGIRTGEITGRGSMISNGKYMARKASSAEKKKAMNGYNSGVEYDALVINRSGSTGFSMHATGKKGNDGKKRHMIVLQPDANIDVFMQMLGRIHRTGQIELPNYTIAISNLAVEKRLAAVLMRKMASLNANTTASKKSAISLDNVTDFMNQYGDIVVAEYLRDNPGLSELTNIRLQGPESVPGIASRLTGRMAIMQPEQVVAVYDDIERTYREFIEALDSMGLNALEAKRLDLGARLIKAEELVAAKDNSSPFGRAAIIETVSVKKIGKPYTLAEVKDSVAKELEVTDGDGFAYADDTAARLIALVPAAQAQADKAIARLTAEKLVAKTEKQLRRIELSLSGWQAKRNAIEDQTATIADRIRDLEPGTPITLTQGRGDEAVEVSGVVLAIDAKRVKENPTAASNITIRIAIADAGREVRLPLSKILGDEPAYSIAPSSQAKIDADFTFGAGEAREERQIVTGNLLGGYAKLPKGQFIIFTDESGATRQGVLMPKNFSASAALDKLPVRFENPAHILKFVKEDAGKRMVKGAKDVIAITAVPGDYRNQWATDTYNLAVTVAEGKPYYLNKEVRRIAGDLVKKGKVMRPERALTERQMLDVIGALQELGVEFETQNNKPAARAITGDTGGMKDVTGDLRVPPTPGNVPLSIPADSDQQVGEIDNGVRVTPIRPEDPTYDADQAASAEIYARMVALGLSEDVALYTVRGISIGAAGYYDHPNKALVVALNQTPGNDSLKDFLGTANHEVMHALRALDLWTDAEWKALVDGARIFGLMDDVETRWGERYRRNGWTPQQLQAAFDEEGVAEYFRQYSELSKELEAAPGLKGKVARSLWKLIEFIDAVQAFVRRSKSSLSLLNKADRGEIGARPRKAPEEDGGQSWPKFNMPPAGAVMGRDTTLPDEGIADAIQRRAQSLTRRIGSFRDGNAVNEVVDRWRTALQDQYLPLRRKQEETGVTPDTDAYRAQELQSGRTGARIERLSDKHVKPLLKAMSIAKVSREELESFLYARHAPERNARIASINPNFGEGEGSGMTDDEAMAIMSEVEAAGRRPVLEQLARRVDAMLKESVRTRVEAGLMSQEDADAWGRTYEFYVPLRGNAELDPEVNTDRPRRGPGITVRGKESKRALGRASQASDILAYSITQAEEAIVRAETNRVAVAFLELAKANPEPGFWSIALVTRKAVFNPQTQQVEYRASNRIAAEDADYTVVAKVEGKERRVVLNKDNPAAAQLAAAMKNLDAPKTAALVQLFGGVNRFLSAVNTQLNPEFVITNALRDLEAASVNLQQFDRAGLTKRVLRDYPKAMRATFGGAFKTDTTNASADVKLWRRWHDEFVMDGGRVFFNNIEDVAEQRKNIERELRDLQSGPGAMKAARAVWGFIGDVNTGVENAVRLSAYKGARESGMSRSDAASLAKNLTVNFNRRGSQGAAINAFYLFYNASIQGTVTMLRAMRSPRVQKLLAGIVATGAALEVLNQMLSGDDDDGEKFYDKISDFDKSRNLIVMVPGGKGQHVKIPLPYGYNGFFQIGRSGVELANGKKPGTVMAGLAMTFVDSFNPIGGTQSLLNFIAPTIADPVVDLARNRDFADRPIMPDERQFGPKTPDNQRYWGSIDPISKAVTDTLNELTGGDSVVPGAADVSPETLQYLFQYATGAAGGFFGVKLPKLLAAAVDPDARAEFTKNDIPMVRKVIGEASAWVDKEAFYERRAEIEQAVAYVKRYAQAGDTASAAAYRAQNSALLSIRGMARATTAALKDVKKARDQLSVQRENGAIDAAAATARKAALKAREDAIITRFNKVYVARVKEAA